MKFVALDVETANPDMSSICQIGIACFNEGTLTKEWKSYIDPQDYFHPMNISIHGIEESTVRGSPILSDIANQIYRYLDDQVCVCHTHFDRVAIRQAFNKYRIRHPNCIWLDSARVARRTWEDFAWQGYGLYNVCKSLGYDFAHHDALEDAKAAGHIVISAINRSGLDIDGWLKRVEQPIGLKVTRKSLEREGNPEGALYGEVLVFTGALCVPRREAVDMASQIGCKVASGVTKETTILVVGDQDIGRLAGHKKSTKHRKAENLISKGQQIRIIKETDFKELVNLKDNPKEQLQKKEMLDIGEYSKQDKNFYSSKKKSHREIHAGIGVTIDFDFIKNVLEHERTEEDIWYESGLPDLYADKQNEIRDLIIEAINLEKSDINKSIETYYEAYKSIEEFETILNNDPMVEKAYCLKYGVSSYRRDRYPVNRLSLLLEKSNRYDECIKLIQDYEKKDDKLGLTITDSKNVQKRKIRILKKLNKY